MSRIFLSHSVDNSAEALALRDWLVSQGWSDLFLDLDPERGLKAGDRWQAALKRAAERCELVIFLISPAWAASKWCVTEFLLAKSLNKRIFGVTVQPTRLSDLPVELTSEWQVVDLTTGTRDHQATVNVPPSGMPVTVCFGSDGLNRLRIGLLQAGLNPSYFAWPPENDPNRPPYRGLRPLEAEDAGIFFGRDGPIVLGLDLLRGLRDAPSPRLLVILGASGAGKSSFMRAGLWPRLARESEHFLPLPVLRPERATLSGETGFIAVLEQALRDAGQSHSRTDIRAAISGGAPFVKPLLSALVSRREQGFEAEGAAHRQRPTLILPIDQAEELFLAEGSEESQTFLELLSNLLSDETVALIALFTIRSDGYERLQTAPELEGLRQHFLSLPPLPRGAYADVIKGPARRLEGTPRACKIEEALVDNLLADIESGGAKDSLPLLAFTLERLYREHGGDGDLRLSEYEQLGRVKGSIEAAVERAFIAADADPKVPRDRDARLSLLRRGLIPWLAGIDPDTGAPRRRVARFSEIPDEARPLIAHLVEQRLLSTDVSKETGEKTVEPAHEALLRQWGLLQGWLTQDSALLSVLDSTKRAARDWAANAKGMTWLIHSGDRLQTTERLMDRPDLAANLEPTDLEYLAACRVQDEATVEREKDAANLRTTAQRRGEMARYFVIGGLAGFLGYSLRVATFEPQSPFLWPIVIGLNRIDGALALFFSLVLIVMTKRLGTLSLRRTFLILLMTHLAYFATLPFDLLMDQDAPVEWKQFFSFGRDSYWVWLGIGGALKASIIFFAVFARKRVGWKNFLLIVLVGTVAGASRGSVHLGGSWEFSSFPPAMKDFLKEIFNNFGPAGYLARFLWEPFVAATIAGVMFSAQTRTETSRDS